MSNAVKNLIEPESVARIDADCEASGLDTYALMKAAGRAVAASALKEFPQALRFVVLAGPGNNGGDGYVAARALVESGAAVEVYQLVPGIPPSRDARRAYEELNSTKNDLSDFKPREGDVIIDALFGAGLSRDLPEIVSRVIEATQNVCSPVIAVDMPSGICGHSGKVRGAAFKADLTITFAALKVGQLLMPGRVHCGRIELANIGIPSRYVERYQSQVTVNSPAIWSHDERRETAYSHKFSHGSVVVFSGEATRSGAARLSAQAALRAGAGLVTIASPKSALAEHAAHLDAIMLKEVESVEVLASQILSDTRFNAFVLGPAFGIGNKAKDFVLALKDRSLVLDADGISSFKDEQDTLFNAFQGRCGLVLTPHEGEFSRLFPDIGHDGALSKVDKALSAAKRANAIIIYKGADTVIASPDGRAAINTNAPPWLATAGSGDVLAGICGGLIAQNYPPYEAACAAVWQHGQAAHRAGKGLTAEILINFIDT